MNKSNGVEEPNSYEKSFEEVPPLKVCESDLLIMVQLVQSTVIAFHDKQRFIVE